MKKFLFTLAALLMAVSAFARTDARYLYVDPSLTFFDEEQDSWVLVLSAEFPAYLNGLEVQINVPDGMEVWDVKGGPDYPITYYNRRGTEMTLDPAISTAAAGPDHFIIAISTNGYYENPEGSGNWVTHSAIKWAAGYYQKFIYAYVDFDASYDGPTDGSNVTVSTTPSSGIDPRGPTVKDEEIGDQGQETTSDPYTPPTAVDPIAPVITYDTQADKVVVTIDWGNSDGNQIYDGQYEYTRPEYGQPDESYEVTAYTEATDNYNESEHVTATIPVPAKDPVWQDVADPEITYETTTDKVIVTVTWPETTGDKVYTGQYEYTRPEYGQPDESYDVTAYTTENYPYRASGVAEATIPVPAKDPVWQAVAAPVIEVVNMDDDYVYVEITWPETTGTHVYTGQLTYPRTDETYTVTVEAYTTENYPYEESQHAVLPIEVPAKAPVVMKNYVKVTATDQLIAGANYIFVDPNDNIAMGEIEGGFGAAVAVTPVTRAADKVAAPEAIEFTLGGQTGAWTFMRGDQYLRGTNSTSLAMGANSDPAEWTVNDNNGALNGYRARNNSYNTRSVKFHNSQNRFGNYANSDVNSDFAYLYIDEEDLPAEKLTPAKPVIEYETLDDKVVVTVTWNESDGNQVYTGQYEYTRPEYGQPDESYDVEAYTEESATYKESEHATETIPVPAKDPVWQNVDKPVITYEVGETAVTVTISWPETTGTHVYTGEVTYPRTDEAYSVDVEAYTEESYPYRESEHAYETIDIPALPVYADKPVIDGVASFDEVYNDNGDLIGTENGIVTVTITAEDGATIMYRYQRPNGTWTDWMPYDGMGIILDKDGSYVVEAYAIVQGKENSETASESFVVTERTGIDELAGGKAVASVRYFNMAGQEMQEANGMTIIVTTYTDGTKSAVKVMK